MFCTHFKTTVKAIYLVQETTLFELTNNMLYNLKSALVISGYLFEVYLLKHCLGFFLPILLINGVKFSGGGVTELGAYAISYRGTMFLTPLKGNLKKDGYLNILRNSAIP